MSVYQEPAFPSTETNEGHFNPGMTLRDHFAGLAMQAYLSGHDRAEFSYDEWAKASYEMADGMLKAREAK